MFALAGFCEWFLIVRSQAFADRKFTIVGYAAGEIGLNRACGTFAA